MVCILFGTLPADCACYIENRTGDFVVQNAPGVDDPVIKPHGRCRANHWEPGGAAPGIPPPQELKKKMGQRANPRAPYRTSRRPANSVCPIPYMGGVAGTQLGPHADSPGSPKGRTGRPAVEPRAPQGGEPPWRPVLKRVPCFATYGTPHRPPRGGSSGDR